ncbi:ArsA family ATPase [Nocardia sp. NPDC127579]|uniref:ArsA family ATPase n=1 Tax=Nocardia sp. NPDC127579 TaxID=3345402 RepID=UPI00362DA23F
MTGPAARREPGARTRLELFVGKGGVGKTTLACATAIAHARTGQRVLIVSLDQAHSLGDALGLRFAHDPGTVTGIIRVATGLDAIEVDSLALLEDRFRDVVRMWSTGGSHQHGIDLAALDPAELTGLPGVQELLMLVELAQFADEDDWDVLVVDCPPSADMLRIVTAPETLLGYLERIWPPHARARQAGGLDLRRAVLAATVNKIVTAVTAVRDLLADHARTGVTLVTVAERVALAETERVHSAAALLGLRLDTVLVNKVLPAVPPGDSAHPAIDWYLARRAEQLAVLEQLGVRFEGTARVLVAEHSGTEPVGPTALLELAEQFDAAGSLGDNLAEVRTSSGEPVVRWESGTGLHSVYTLRMRLPVVDPATLRLGRVEDDVIVGADGVRRRVRLAPVLRRCTVDGAELDGHHLVLRFVPDPELWPR